MFFLVISIVINEGLGLPTVHTYVENPAKNSARESLESSTDSELTRTARDADILEGMFTSVCITSITMWKIITL